jgi:hypothetical protein
MVHAEWEGPIDAEQRHGLRKAIHEFCLKNSTKKFIVDLRKQEHVVNAKESYEFGRTFRREMRGFKLAVIVQRGIKTEFIISEIINRGDVVMKTFTEFEEGLSWLSDQ